jgi:hypothetical protein
MANLGTTGIAHSHLISQGLGAVRPKSGAQDQMAKPGTGAIGRFRLSL